MIDVQLEQINPINVSVERTETNVDGGTTYIRGEKGDKGDTPVITATRQGNATILYSDGVEFATILDGQDGHSPIITATKVGKTTTIKADGIAIATIVDGNDGRDGQDGRDGTDGHSPIVTATKEGKVTTIKVDDVAIATINDGQDGQDGQDGHSPSVTATKDGKVTTIYVDSQAIATINDGNDGEQGEAGYTPQREIDYWTPTDKQEIINDVMDEVGDVVHYTEDTNTRAEREQARANLKVRPYLDVIKTTTLQDLRYTDSTIYNATYSYVKFGEIKPIDYNKPCYVKLRYRASLHDSTIKHCFQDSILEYNFVPYPTSSSDDTLNGYKMYSYNFDNLRTTLVSMQYFTYKDLTEQGRQNKAYIPFGTRIYTSMYKYTTISRDITIDVLEMSNCDVDLMPSSNPTYAISDANFIGSTSVSSDHNAITNGDAVAIGNKHTGDLNTTYTMNTQVGTNLVMGNNENATSNKRNAYYYRMLATREDGKVEAISVTYGTTIKNYTREPNLHLKALLGEELYIYGSTTARAPEYVFASTLYIQNDTYNSCYNFSSDANGYLKVGNASVTDDDMNKPVYLKAKINEDGKTWSLDPEISTTDISLHLTFDLPTTNDGYIYIKLFNLCNSKNIMRFAFRHPIYMHDGTMLKIIA